MIEALPVQKLQVVEVGGTVCLLAVGDRGKGALLLSFVVYRIFRTDPLPEAWLFTFPGLPR